MSSVGEASVVHDDVLDTPDFNVAFWARDELQERELPQLLQKREKLQDETLQLDAELQGMVYYNYSNYAEGTRLVGGLNERVEEMNAELAKLQTSLERNQAFLAETNGATCGTQEKVKNLVAITATLNGVQQLLELPGRLMKSIRDKELDVGVRLWEKGRGMLKRHANVPSLAVIRGQCEPVVDEIEAMLWGSLSSRCGDTVRSSIKSLRTLGKTSRRMDVELRARIMGEVARDLDAVPSVKVVSDGTSLSAALTTLLQCMTAAELSPAEITDAAIEMIAPRLALLAAESCSKAVLENDTAQLSDCAAAVAEDLAVLALELEEFGDENVRTFVRETLNEHVSSALCGDVFEAYPSGATPQAREATTKRMTHESLARAKLIYYLSLDECHESAGLPKCNADVLPVARGLLLRYAQLEAQAVCKAMRTCLRTTGDSGECRVGPLVIAHLMRVVQRIGESPFPDSVVTRVTQRLLHHTATAVVEEMRDLVLGEEALRSLQRNVVYMAQNFPRLGLKEENVGQWASKAHQTLRERCRDDVGEVDEEAMLEETGRNDSVADLPDSESPQLQVLRGVPDSWNRGPLIGRWAQGNVFLGKRPDGSTDAVKVTELDEGVEDSHLADMMKEIQALSSLRNPCVAAVYGALHDSHQHELHLFTEHVTGSTLGALVRRSPTAWSEAKSAKYVKQVVAGLSFLHARGVVHRDIKGDSVMVAAETGNVKIVDIVLEHTLATSNQKGTALWMAPEVITGADCTPMSDVWSFGILVCEVLGCGKTPWEPFASTSEALQVIGTWDKPLPPRVPNGLSSKAQDFLVCCLRPSRMKRWTMHALQQHVWLRAVSQTHQSAPLVTPRGCALELSKNFSAPSQPCDLKVCTVVSACTASAAGYTGLFPQ